MDRRGFLRGIIAAAAAPAIVRADSLMRIVPREATIAVPTVKNGLMTLEMMTAEMMRVFSKRLVFADSVNRLWEAESDSVIAIRKPPRFYTA